MGRIAAIGAPDRVRGFTLAGVIVHAAEDPAAVLATWQGLPSDVEVVVLTPTAASVLGAAVDEPSAPLVVVLPEGEP